MTRAWPALAAGIVLTAGVALAQSPNNAGQGPDETASPKVSVEERAMLPAAGSVGSAAPGARVDCTKNPRDCSEPVNPAGSGATPPGMPQQSK